jgi:hydroxymethylpyrimidine pyrophosphatase-like HAD family hydrolase
LSDSIRNILIFDFDGTLTLDDTVIPEITKKCLSRIKEKDIGTLGIISGRDLRFLQDINESLSDVFSFLVAENGAISYFLDTKEKTVLGADWSEKAKKVLLNSGIPLHFAEIMFATRIQYAPQISEFLDKTGLEAKMVPNKDSLMVLPPDVDKGTGVAAAVQHYGETKQLFLTCFGDGENDLALFAPADLRVAVANSVDALKKIADVVTTLSGGLGVAEYLNSTFLADHPVKD